jgi:hypothetical protein
VIGASRITYAMSSYRQLPEVFRRLHPSSRRRGSSLVVFAGLSRSSSAAGQTTSSATCTRSARCSRSRSRTSRDRAARAARGRSEAFKSRPNLRVRGVDWPLFAIFGALGTAPLARRRRAEAGPRWAGLGWLVVGLLVYVVYRARAPSSLTETMRAPVIIGPALALEYRNILVRSKPGRESEEAIDFACRLATERRRAIVALASSSCRSSCRSTPTMPSMRAVPTTRSTRANGDRRALRRGRTERLIRARSAGSAIVD